MSSFFSRIRFECAIRVVGFGVVSATLWLDVCGVSYAQILAKNGGYPDLVMQTVPIERIKYTSVYFATNRLVEPNGSANAFGSALKNYDAIFSNDSSVASVLAYACISYPSDREAAEQDYADESTLENPLKSFTVTKVEMFPSFASFGQDISMPYRSSKKDISCSDSTRVFNAELPPLVYIHGWNTTFSSSVERAAQLAIDTGRRNLVALSWPSNKSNIITGYDDALIEEATTSAYVPFYIDEVKSGAGERIDLLAHSMGSRLFFDSYDKLVLLNGNIGPFRNVVLAAPDISRADFNGRSDQWQNEYQRIEVYCANDIILSLSGPKNGFRDRLGFCTDPKFTLIKNSEVIKVSGDMHDFWRHSYYLSSPEMIGDLKRIFDQHEKSKSSEEDKTHWRYLSLH